MLLHLALFQNHKCRPPQSHSVRHSFSYDHCSRHVLVAIAAEDVSARVSTPGLQGAQGLLNFDTAAAESAVEVLEEPDAPLEQRIKTAADDYQLQMQGYALALRELLPANVTLRSLRATLHFIDPNIEVPVAAALLDPDACIGAIDDAMNTIARAATATRFLRKRRHARR